MVKLVKPHWQNVFVMKYEKYVFAKVPILPEELNQSMERTRS
jgi:hypothetical protein